ncbi:MAG: Hint domain-containing protein [Gemmobacter sp.]|uniref:Hint domain-containing protein n=1 Tax=Gemmobacter sp. TaxID=1898957 RepID=UPI00391CAA20
MPVFALYNFNDTDTTIQDSALGNGAQNGLYMNGAVASGGQAVLDGVDDIAKIYASPIFQMDRGTLAMKFTQTAHVGDNPNTILSRDSVGNAEGGGYRVEVLKTGAIVVSHETASETVTWTTGPGFMQPGDTIDFSYSWDFGGSEPGRLVISNITTGNTYSADVPNTVTMDMGSQNQNWIIGGGQAASPPDTLAGIDQHFNGTAEFLSFSDSIDNKGNADPIANPDTAVTDEDTSVTIPVLANDSDPNGDTLTVTGATATNGTVTVNPDGTLIYTPNPDYNGPDTITYTVTDGNGGSATSTVAVTVNPVNDAPVANDDTASTAFNTPVTIAVLANDTDVDGDALAVLGTPTSADGTVTVNPDGTITFTPNAGFSGVAVIDYGVTDGNGGTDTAQVLVTVGAPLRDGIVYGTAAGDLIDVAYTGDNDGDMIDAGDAILPNTAPDDDFVLAGNGNDTVLAGQGNDLVFGEDGDDELYGGDGFDALFGGNGNDAIYGGADNDLLDGDAGDDLLFGGTGDDALIGADGNDTLNGDAGNDTLVGGNGDDLLFGGDGNDVIAGGTGNDTITGSTGNNTLSGGDDRDVFLGATVGDLIDGGEGGDDFDTLDLRGSGPLRVTYDSDNPENGIVSFLDADRNVIGTTRFVNIENVVPCFTPGTLIATPRGEVPVEDLKVGDRVITRDNGIQDIRWVGRRDMTAGDFAVAPHLRPVLVRKGALGNGLPERDMMVSPNHRLLVANDRTALYFDEHEVLVAAKHLLAGEAIRAIHSSGTSYIHFMCDRHEVVLSNGAWTETFQPGDQTLKGMGNAQRSELFEIFPELKTPAGVEGYAAARKTLKRHEALLLVR